MHPVIENRLHLPVCEAFHYVMEASMRKFHVKNFLVGGVCLMSTVLVLPVCADDIEASIKEALQSYQDGEYRNAVEKLDYASQLIRQKRAKALEALLPEPLSGWAAQKPSSQAMGASMFGGGITAERRYSKDSSSIVVKIISDSPLMQSLMMMFSNPLIAASSGGRFEKISGQKAYIEYLPERRKGEIRVIVADRFLVLVQGRDVSMEDLKKYAEAIDYEKLQSSS